ncbi:MAG: hypothetical protein V3T72_17945 [Thermoanaerobaculia bacterium]
MAALLFLIVVAWFAGRGWIASEHEPLETESRLVMSWIAGLLSIFALLLVLHLFGIPWRPAILVPLLVAGAALGWIKQRRHAPTSSWQPAGWGDATAAAAFLVFLAGTVLLWDLHPDFIYHWGLKAEKFHLAAGLDFEFLASPWNAHIHPDYPNLLPSLFAVTAILGGAFGEVPMALWSALFYLATVLMGRQLLRQTAATEFARQAGVAILALTLTMFGVGYLTAGGADWLLTLVVMSAAVFFTVRPDAGHDLPVGMLAAFSAAAKIEGIPLAVWLIGVHLVRRWRHRCGGTILEMPLALVRSALPAVLVTGIWAWQVTSHGLFQPGNTGAFDWGRAPVVFPELWHSLMTVNWHGLTFCLVALPLLLVVRRTRWIAAVVCLQLAFYVYVYLSASVDPREYVVTSAARLFFHLVPAVLVMSIAAADRWSAKISSPSEAADG